LKRVACILHHAVAGIPNSLPEESISDGEIKKKELAK
jgi:hypothetical protein